MTPWHALAACRGTDPAWFDAAAPPEHLLIAAAVCHSCPVAADCAADAVVHRDVGVIRAGYTISDTGHWREITRRRVEDMRRKRRDRAATLDELCEDLTVERFAVTTPEWHNDPGPFLSLRLVHDQPEAS